MCVQASGISIRNPHPWRRASTLYRYLAARSAHTAGPRGLAQLEPFKKKVRPPLRRCGRIIQRHGHARQTLLIQSPSYSIFYNTETSPAASSSLICPALPELGCRRSLFLLFSLTGLVSGC